MPPKKKAIPKKSNEQQFTDSLQNDLDRYGEEFIKANSVRFNCILPNCQTLADNFRESKCGHTFYACEQHKYALSKLFYSAQECLFCYRRLMDNVCKKFEIEQTLDLKEDFYGDAQFRDSLLKPAEQD